MSIVSISRTFDALVDETHDTEPGEHIARAGILVDGQAYHFRYQRGAAALGLGRNVADAAADPRTVTTAYGEPGRAALEPSEFRAVMLDLLKLHPAAPPFPLEAHDVVTVQSGTRLLDVLRIEGDMARVAPHDGAGDPRWVEVSLLHRVDRYGIGVTSDGAPWRVDQLHDRVRLILGEDVVDTASALGRPGASGAFETIWRTFSRGCTDAWRSDTTAAATE